MIFQSDSKPGKYAVYFFLLSDEYMHSSCGKLQIQDGKIRIETERSIYEFEEDQKCLTNRRRRGLYVHLSKDYETAKIVGSRHEKSVVYQMNAGKIAADGYLFYLSVNVVWLTKEVPVRYLSIFEKLRGRL